MDKAKGKATDDKVIKHGIHYLANLFLICVINAIRFIFNVQWLFFFKFAHLVDVVGYNLMTLY